MSLEEKKRMHELARKARRPCELDGIDEPRIWLEPWILASGDASWQRRILDALMVSGEFQGSR